jgi:hypothetical protein
MLDSMQGESVRDPTVCGDEPIMTGTVAVEVMIDARANLLRQRIPAARAQRQSEMSTIRGIEQRGPDALGNRFEFMSGSAVKT